MNIMYKRENIYYFMVQVCQGGECVYSDYGLDLLGKIDNIFR